MVNYGELLTLSGLRRLSYRNQSIDLLCKSMDWFLYDNDLRHERVNYNEIYINRNTVRQTRTSCKATLLKSHFGTVVLV